MALSGLSWIKGTGLNAINLSATGADFQSASFKTPSILMDDCILLAAIFF
ncbi:MAG: hypothetical protein R2765_09290 [Ferruginibacter sp.]